jgi:hypothetical protein
MPVLGWRLPNQAVEFVYALENNGELCNSAKEMLFSNCWFLKIFLPYFSTEFSHENFCRIYGTALFIAVIQICGTYIQNNIKPTNSIYVAPYC